MISCSQKTHTTTTAAKLLRVNVVFFRSDCASCSSFWAVLFMMGYMCVRTFYLMYVHFFLSRIRCVLRHFCRSLTFSTYNFSNQRIILFEHFFAIHSSGSRIDAFMLMATFHFVTMFSEYFINSWPIELLSHCILRLFSRSP